MCLMGLLWKVDPIEYISHNHSQRWLMAVGGTLPSFGYPLRKGYRERAVKVTVMCRLSLSAFRKASYIGLDMIVVNNCYVTIMIIIVSESLKNKVWNRANSCNCYNNSWLSFEIVD